MTTLLFGRQPRDIEWPISITINPQIVFLVSAAINIYALWYVLRKSQHPQLKFEALILLSGAFLLSMYLIRIDVVFAAIVGLVSIFISYLACKLAAKNPHD